MYSIPNVVHHGHGRLGALIQLYQILRPELREVNIVGVNALKLFNSTRGGKRRDACVASCVLTRRRGMLLERSSLVGDVHVASQHLESVVGVPFKRVTGRLKVS